MVQHKLKENVHTEFKSSFNDTVIETLVAFANTNGGKVLVGVDNEGVPLKNFMIGDETVQQWINEIKNKTQPALIPDSAYLDLAGGKVVELFVKEFPIKPVSFKGRYYKRVKNSNHQLNLTEIADLHLKTFNSSWDNYTTNDYTTADISLDKVKAFIETGNRLREIKIADDPMVVLNKFELLKENSISNACHLLFAKNEVFKATIELGRFSAPALIKDAVTLRQDLFTEIEEVFNFIKKHINKEYVITGNLQRQERWQYPLDALREIIVNMIVHRDYMHHGDSSVKIYDNSIEFFNPGGLPDTISIRQLLDGNYVSQTRNKKLAAMFKEAGVIEKYGSGIKRIQQQFIAHGLPAPVFENFQHGFMVVVTSFEQDVVEDVVENVVENVVEDVVEKERLVLELIVQNNRITATEIAKKLTVAARTVQRHLKNLQLKGKIKRMGAAKGGYWKVESENKN